MVTIASTCREADACTAPDRLSTTICHKDELTLKHVNELILLINQYVSKRTFLDMAMRI